jgi:hypothetical protein
LIGKNTLEYYPYYFATWIDRIKLDPRPTVKNVLSQWASALVSLRSGLHKAVYLPYSLDDQVCKYLKAELSQSDIVFTDLQVRCDGHALDLDDLSEVIYSEPKIDFIQIDRFSRQWGADPRFFGKFNADEVIQALNNAELVDG